MQELRVKVVLVSFDESSRVERSWESLSRKEQERLSEKLTERMMSAAGYVRETQ